MNLLLLLLLLLLDFNLNSIDIIYNSSIVNFFILNSNVQHYPKKYPFSSILHRRSMEKIKIIKKLIQTTPFNSKLESFDSFIAS